MLNTAGLAQLNWAGKKFQNFVSILKFINETNFMLSWVEHEKSFITSGPEGFMLSFWVIRISLYVDKIHRTKIHFF